MKICYRQALVVLLLFSYNYLFAQNGADIVKQLIAKNKLTKTLSYTLKKTERINGSLKAKTSFFKINVKPLKIYIRQISPEEGIEVIYATGENNNKVLINPNKFPWVTISLEPYSHELTKTEHHTVYESGMTYMLSLLEYVLNKYSSELNEMIKYDGPVKWGNYNCYMITMFDKHFKYLNYTVGAGENLVTIAKKFQINEYMILEKNPKLRNYYDVKKGDIIKIPNDYSQKMILYVDKKSLFPVLIKVYDEVGLYEQYDYSNIVINPTFAADEFSKTNKNYKFK
jgi:outer membrane lipoprotein-sorting protein